VTHRRTIFRQGSSKCITIPPEYLSTLGLDAGDIVTIELHLDELQALITVRKPVHTPDTSQGGNMEP